MKILVTGITGQVGWELIRALQPLGTVIGVSSQQMNLANPDAIRKVVREIKPDLIVNPAAYTAVDKAESESPLVMQINGIAPGILAEEASRLHATLIHYSTDYVFDGTKNAPYTEDDLTNPQSVYGSTKLAGEQAIQAVGCNYLIFRTSWIYSARGKNFLRTILKLAKERETLQIVHDQIGAPTSARLIADTTAQITAKINNEQKNGQFESCLLNLTSTGTTSWYHFASKIVEQVKDEHATIPLRIKKIEPITTNEYPLIALRPANSCLSHHRFTKRFQLVLPAWESGTKLCIAEWAEISKST